jgi:hypothetical protein
MVILGESSSATEVLKFFLMQAIVISIESMAFNIWAAMSGTTRANVPATGSTKILGYIWVLAWTSWTAPE